MNTNRKPIVLRFLMIITVMAMLLGLAGGMPAAVSAQEASYIVQASNTEMAVQLVQTFGGEITSRLDIIHAVAANLSSEEVAQLREADGILAITPNGTVKSSGDDQSAAGNTSYKKDKGTGAPSTDYPNVVGADFVWKKGITGEGVTVAVLDTGLGGQLTQLTKDIKGKSGRIVGWMDVIGHSKKPIDPNGHGSHVAGIIANSEKGDDKEWNGVAPGVDLVGVRVLDETGAGSYETVIAGLQWVLENKDRLDIKVVNLSLVAPVQSPYWADPLDQAVTVAWANGLTVIVAAGNYGPDAMSISVPGNNPYAVTVGAFTDAYTPDEWSDDYIAPFSSTGPTLDGFVKPDVVAPGGHIVSLVPDESFLANEYPDNTLKGNYFKLAGTSMSTAVVSGIAALVIAENEDLTPDQVKYRLTISANPWVSDSFENTTYSMFQQGSGRVNAPEAVFAKTHDSANEGMDIYADIAGSMHYEGYAYYDETTGTYHLRDPFSDWNDGYATWDGKSGAWSGKFGTWTGKSGAWSGKSGAWSGKSGAWSGKSGAWSGKSGAWSGKSGAWSGKSGAWSGKSGAWSGGYTTWSGKSGAWSGKSGAWSGKSGAWSGKSGAWSGSLDDPTFMASFAAGLPPSGALSIATISNFLLEP